jgi:hypothetical protein
VIGAAAARGPSVGLPLAYLTAAAGAFVLAALGVVWLAPLLAGHYYHPRLLALTHTVTLGWITLTIMGASYQIVPIVLGRRLWSERLARWQLGVFLVGVVGMVAHFFIAEWSGLLWAAALVALASAAHVLNLALTVRGLWRTTFTARMLALALGGLALTVASGAALGVDRVRPFLPWAFFPALHAHMHLALLGWVLPMVLGVAARVYPMFLLAGEPAGWPGRVQFWGVAAGVPALTLGLLESPALAAAGALLVAAAIAAHLAWVLASVRGRRRPALDWGLRFALAGALALVPATFLGLGLGLDALGGPRASLAYAALALGGWASLTIVGMMLKIVPFLVWYRVWGPRVGREPVPTLGALAWPRAEAAAFALLVGGVPALAAALAAGDAAWIRSAGALVVAGALGFGLALGRVLCHLTGGAARRRLTAPPAASAPLGAGR